MNNIVEVPSSGKFQRIVSLVPSQTEFLYDLGLDQEVVGITKFCIHPQEWFASKKRVGGTKNVSTDKVSALNPDLIIGNKEENDQENILQLTTIAPIWMSDIYHLQDAFSMMLSLGELTGKILEADEIIEETRNRFDQIEPLAKPLRTLYFIWANPWMIAGAGTFIDDMLQKCGMMNATTEERYPTIELSRDESIQLVLLSSEPFPFKEKHQDLLREYYPNAKIILVDGEMFSWYGSRLKLAPSYFQDCINSLG